MLKVQNQHHLEIVPSNKISTIPLPHSRFPVSPPQSKDLFSGDHVLDPGQISVPDSSMMDKVQTVSSVATRSIDGASIFKAYSTVVLNSHHRAHRAGNWHWSRRDRLLSLHERTALNEMWTEDFEKSLVFWLNVFTWELDKRDYNASLRRLKGWE